MRQRGCERRLRRLREAAAAARGGCERRRRLREAARGITAEKVFRPMDSRKRNDDWTDAIFSSSFGGDMTKLFKLNFSHGVQNGPS